VVDLNGRLGAHSPFNAEAVRYLHREGMRVFQYSIGSPAHRIPSYQDLFRAYKEQKDKMPEDMVSVAHAPFWYNMVKANWLSERTMEDLKHQLSFAHALGTKYYVVHIGYAFSRKDLSEGGVVPTNISLQSAVGFFQRFLKPLENAGIKILLENCPGVSTGGMPGTLNNVLSIVDRIDSPSIGLCLDTQHAWAAGDLDYGDLSQLKKALTVADIIHLNGNPPGIEFGSFTDRHSKQLLSESYGFEEEALRVVLTHRDDHLFVFERDFDSVDVMVEDFKYCNRIVADARIPG